MVISTFFGAAAASRPRPGGGPVPSPPPAPELAFGYFIIAAPMALVVGYLADFLSRRWLFAAVLLLDREPQSIGSRSCLFC